MIEKNVNKTDNGVDIEFTGEVNKTDVQNMVNDCSSGQCSCNCDPSLLNKIKEMSVNGIDGKVTISLKGQEIELSEVQNAVNSCNIGC